MILEYRCFFDKLNNLGMLIIPDIFNVVVYGNNFAELQQNAEELITCELKAFSAQGKPLPLPRTGVDYSNSKLSGMPSCVIKVKFKLN